jgi:O-antigen biosynthesis protein
LSQHLSVNYCLSLAKAEDSQPLISVCVPVYNGSAHLGESLSSIENQTYANIEICISDDGSRDGSIELVENFNRISKFATVFYRNSLLGIAGNCNFLIEKARGEYIKFLFQDDLLEPTCIEKLAGPAIFDKEIRLVFSERKLQLDSPKNLFCQRINEGCRNLPNHWSNLRHIQKGHELLEDPQLLSEPINKIGEPTTTLILKSALVEAGGFDPELEHLLDVDLWNRLLTRGKVAYVDESLSTFRVHDKQQSVANLAEDKAREDAVRLYKKLLTLRCFSQLSQDFRARTAEKLVAAVIGDKVPVSDLEKTRSDLEKTRSDLEKTRSDLEKTRSDLEKTIENLRSRIRFLEGTYAWKVRRQFMRLYYLFNPSKKKKPPNSQSVENEEGNSPFIKFGGFSKIHFECQSEPLASIIIPFFNQLELTHLCLQSIHDNIGLSLKYEVILIDDCSDDFKPLDDCLEGVIAHRNEVNSGFVHSCNIGASLAKGKYLVFLNNDTQVADGWLSELLGTFTLCPETGVVGSKLLFPDGRLQEAGGIIWKDGTGCNYGKGTDPNSPQYNYLREVDYCSGASLAIPEELFDKLGGFSEKFHPAYYEDTDLCFKARSAGCRVIYQPRSVVYHVEGATSGTSEESGAKAFQKKNRIKFLDSWKDALTQHFPPSGDFSEQYKASTRLAGKTTILIIDTYLPLHDKESGSHRIFHLIKILKELSCHVMFLPDNGSAEEPYASELLEMGIELLVDQTGQITPTEFLKERLSCIDIAWICRPQMFSKYSSLVRSKSNASILYDTIDLHYLRVQRLWELGGSNDPRLKKKWKAYHRLETKCSSKADLTLTVTNEEAEIVESWNCPVHVVPNVHIPRTDSPPPFEERNGLLFIGSYLHPPNMDAVNWLCREIMPILWQKNPELELTLLGSNPTPEVKELAGEKIFVPGFIQNVEPYFDKARVFVAPLRYGAGMKGKVGQSMSLGLPVVTTPIGAEGMNLKNGKHAFIREDPAGIADNINTLLADKEKWNELSEFASRHMGEFSPEKISVNIKDILKNSL